MACFVRRAFQPERRLALEPADAEMLVLELRTTPSLLIAVWYCPPDDARALAATMTALEDVAAALVVTGDFNVPDITWANMGAVGATPPPRCVALIVPQCCWTAAIWRALPSMLSSPLVDRTFWTWCCLMAKPLRLRCAMECFRLTTGRWCVTSVRCGYLSRW